VSEMQPLIEAVALDPVLGMDERPIPFSIRHSVQDVPSFSLTAPCL
jgi:hypothetical protein